VVSVTNYHLEGNTSRFHCQIDSIQLDEVGEYANF